MPKYYRIRLDHKLASSRIFYDKVLCWFTKLWASLSWLIIQGVVVFKVPNSFYWITLLKPLQYLNSQSEFEHWVLQSSNLNTEFAHWIKHLKAVASSPRRKPLKINHFKPLIRIFHLTTYRSHNNPICTNANGIMSKYVSLKLLS